MIDLEGYRAVSIYRRPSSYCQYASDEPAYDEWLVTDGALKGTGSSLKRAIKDYDAECARDAFRAFQEGEAAREEKFREQQAVAKAKRAATLAAKKAAL